MNIKRIIREEIDDFDWAKDVGIYDALDKHFNLEKTNKGFKIKGIDSEFDKNSIPRIILPWHIHSNETLHNLLYLPTEKIESIKNTPKNKLFKIVYGKSVWDLNYFENRKISNELLKWKTSRIEGLKEEYELLKKYSIPNIPIPV